MIVSMLVILGILLMAGCGRDENENGNAGQTVTDAPEAGGTENASETSAVGEKPLDTQEERAAGNASEIPTEDGENAAGNAPEDAAAGGGETVEYSHDEQYMSVTLPDGWDYQIKTAEEMEKEDGLSLCAIVFWQEDYPETRFTLSYETFFGICGTGVTIEEFAWENGLSGYRYTEEIEDTLWLTITLHNKQEDTDSGTYCIIAGPALSVWDEIETEFEEILASVWVGAR